MTEVICPACGLGRFVPAAQAGQSLPGINANCHNVNRVPDLAPPPVVVVHAERCYDCGWVIPEGQVVRWTITTASGSLYGSDPNRHTTYATSGYWSAHTNVSLCPR